MSGRTIAALFAFEFVAFSVLTVAQLDRKAHLGDPATAINQWGYRQEARAVKERNELRVAVVGGSTAFEGHLTYGATFAGKLLTYLNQLGAPKGHGFSVSNLAEPRVGADSYVQTLHDYAYLNPDAVVIFDGYDTMAGLPPHARRHSFVYRNAGYLPVLPARLLGRPGWMSDPDAGIVDALRDDRGGSTDASCEGASRRYCADMAATVSAALTAGYPVAVVSPPIVSEAHRRQQQSLAALLTQRFAADRRFKYFDTGQLDLDDPMNAVDRVRRTDLGNHIIAQRIAAGLIDWPAFPGYDPDRRQRAAAQRR
jgi:hypothetical protein